jgi:replicative DNA helicase
MIDTKELEKAIIATLMREEDEIDYYIKKLKQEYFTCDLARFMFNAIHELRKRKRPIDAHLVLGVIRNHFDEHKVPSGDVYNISQCSPSSKNLEHYIQELIDYRHKENP